MIKDSGDRSVYPTGAQRDNGEDKGRPSLIVTSALRRLALQLEAGARKYEDRNWEKGMDADRYVDGLFRHVFAFMEGDTSENHLGAALFNLVALSHTFDMVRVGRLPKELFRNLPDVDFNDIIPVNKVLTLRGTDTVQPEREYPVLGTTEHETRWREGDPE
jgi:hypothetical protein